MNDQRRCTAKVSDGSGRRCKKVAMLGQKVCRSHGGASPQAQRSARDRLNALVEPAIAGLSKALKSGDVNALIRASVAVLDRCGFHPSQAIELSGKDGGPLQAEQPISLDSLSLEGKRRILEILEAEGIESEVAGGT